MCGRFSQFKEINEIRLRFKLDQLGIEWNDPLFQQPRYNIAPTQIVPIVVREADKTLRLMKWGLVPSWAQDQSIGNRMINARAETLIEKPSFRHLVESRRCIVPATGFYEWAKTASGKVPMHIVPKDRGLFGFAGLWDIWKAPNGEGRDCYSFTIITTSPNKLMADIHNRMPVILKREDEEPWLDQEIKDSKDLLPMLAPYPAEEMEAYEVSRLVNSPANNSPECVEPVRML